MSKKMVIVEEVDETPKVVESPKEEIKENLKDEKIVVTETAVEPLIESPAEELEEKTNYLWIIVPVALLVGALVGGLITYFSGISKLSSTDVTPSPVASVESDVKPTATPEPKSEVDRSKVKLQVLNGSGVSGLAGKAKTYLEELGYKDIVVGNASVSNLTETTVSLKDSKKDLLETVVADLAKNYKVAEKTETLSAPSKYDFVITLGSK